MTVVASNYARKENSATVLLADARALGLRWYFTGLPCPKGHVSKRSVSNRDCRACVEARKVPEKKRERARRYWANNAKKCRIQVKESRQRHLEKRRKSERDRYASDPVRKAAVKLQAVRWQKRNPGICNYLVALRRARIKRATPPWLTKEHRRQIRSFYLDASSRVGEWHVDHIYPLRGKTSCGLHVPWNLRVITADENRKKGNRI